MSQVFKNGARTELDNGITAATTQFTVLDGTIFPEANASVTGGAINQSSGDWFKLVLQDDDGNFEIVYCYGHEDMTHTFTVLRGQEGTTAFDFSVGTVVGLRFLSSDLDTIHSTMTLLDETKQEKTVPAAKADALTAARQISLTGAVQAIGTWDASGALELVTDKIDVSKANAGILAVGRGGTGKTTHAAGQVLVGNGTGEVYSLAIDTTTGGTNISTSLITSGAVHSGLAFKANQNSPAFTGSPTAPTQPKGNNTTRLATTAFVTTAVDNAVSELLGSAPAAALDTLKELGDALGNDANFAATMTNSLATKVDKVTGKGLSTNDFTTALLNKLNGVADGANNFSLPAGTNGQVLKHNGSAWVAGTDLNTTYVDATTSNNGLMSAADKTKLDGVEAGANNFALPTGTNGQVLKHNGTTWVAGTDNNTSYGSMPASVAAAGTATTAQLITAQVLKGAIAAHSNPLILRAADNRTVKPADVTEAAVTTFFASKAGLTGTTADGVYGDMLALNTYTDGSGGSVNGLFFAKNTQQEIIHYQAAFGATAWANPKTIAYTTSNVASATKLETARTINGVSFDGTANITVADATKLPLTGGTLSGALTGSRFISRAAGNDYGISSFEATGDGGSILPGYGFHQPGVFAGLLQQNNASTFSFYTQGRASYANLQVGALSASGNVTAFSDRRLKKDLVEIDGALAKVKQLTGYTYTRIDTGERQTGLVAQDVQRVLPEAAHLNPDGYLSVAYGNMVGLLVEAVKTLAEKVEKLEGK